MGITETILLASLVGGFIGGVICWFILSRRRNIRHTPSDSTQLPHIVEEVLDAVNQYAVVYDEHLKPIYINVNATVSSTFSLRQVENTGLLELARQVLETGIPETHFPDPDNPEDTLRIQILRLNPRFLLVLVQDLGDSHRVNAMRRDFIANVSHELKTPISAIGLLSEAVLEAAEDPVTVRAFGKRLLKTSRRLSELSRDIIQLSEAQSVQGFSEREVIKIVELLRIEIDAHRDLAYERNITFRIEDTALPIEELHSFGQPAAIATVFANILSNAIRHSPDNSFIDVKISATGKRCNIVVTDFGEGIASDQLPRIFERFYRIDSARSRKMGGTGLGLSIAKHTMQAHGGDIRVSSTLGKGSSFTLTFPLIDPQSTHLFTGPIQKIPSGHTGEERI